MVTLTAKGYIKKLDLGDFLSIPASGIMFIKLEPGDYVKDIMIINNKSDIIVYSDRNALRMNMEDVPHFKRNTKGSRSMITDGEIDGMSIIKHDTTDIVVITESGRINRFDVVALPRLGRANKGSSVIKLSKTDSIKAIYGLNTSDIVRVTTKNGKMDIPVTDMEIGSSISTGNKMIPLKGDVIIRCDIVKQ
jgi:DNA gyrase/topoisomerase IV subunit A